MSLLTPDRMQYMRDLVKHHDLATREQLVQAIADLIEDVEYTERKWTTDHDLLTAHIRWLREERDKAEAAFSNLMIESTVTNYRDADEIDYTEQDRREQQAREQESGH